mgnify:FL=1
MKEDIRNVQKMERKWKEGTSDHAGGSLKWNDDDLLLCGDGPGCKLDERRCDKRSLFTEAITKVQDVFRSGYSFAIVVAVGLFVLLFIYAGVKLSFGDTSDAKQTKQKIFRIFVGMICAFGAILLCKSGL